MMISVAMCTYNGEKYLAEQLESILRQDHPVDELVVCDDGSSDRTIAILNEFAQKAPFVVGIHVNEKNLRSTKNFEKALTLCQGDILILCDQDDLWKPHKVSRQVSYLEEHPEIDAVFSNGDLINEVGEKQDLKLWDSIGFYEDKQHKWKMGGAREILFEGYVVTGATLALRKRCLQLVCPFPVDLGPFIHDAWIALVLSLSNKINFIEEELISYRVHETQQVGFGPKIKKITLKDRIQRTREEKLAPIIYKANLLKNVYERLSEVKGLDPQSYAPLKEIQEHYRVRATLPANRLYRIKPALSEFLKGRYTYSSEHWWLPLLGDLFE